MKIIFFNYLLFLARYIILKANKTNGTNTTDVFSEEITNIANTTNTANTPNTINITNITNITNTANTINITNKTECLKSNDGSKYPTVPCFFEALYPKIENKTCHFIPYSSYYSGYSKEYINNVLYNVTCNGTGVKTYALETCGKGTASKSFDDCKEHSTFVDSCCYFSGNRDQSIDQGEQKLERGCYWLGSKYEGTIDWAGVKLKCFDKYLNSLFSMISFLLFF